jgi:glycosyltransferase involved in cell wall biosynthesis
VFDAPSVECLPAAVNDLLIGGNVEGYVLAVGSHDPRKNFARLVEAYRRLPGEIRRAFPLVIAGGASRIYAAGSDETDDDVSRLGYVSDPELAALYASASVVVMPSLDEGFGLPLVEARAARAKLAVSDIPVFRWVAGDTARYFDPLDVADIASAVLSVLEGSWSPPEGAPIERRFDWATTADTIETFARALT